MHAEYKKEMGKSYLFLEAGQTEEEFSTQMLLENQIQGLLGFEKRSFNGEIQFFYDITGKHSLESHVREELLQEKEVRRLLQCLYCVIEELHSYFLDAGGLLMESEYIYEDDKGFSFCYYPSEEKNTPEEKLMDFAEYLLEMIDHEDEDAVQLVYCFYKMVKESEKGILWILEDALIQEISEKIPEEEVWYTQEKEHEEPMEKRNSRDMYTIICFLISLLVSLCYLGTSSFTLIPNSAATVIAYVFVFASIPGIVAGFVDIERKK